MNEVEIALINPKFARNVGSVIRAASCFAATNVLYTGDRLDLTGRLPREERMKGYGQVNWSQADPTNFITRRSHLTPVAVELLPNCESLVEFEHPDNALYIFGPEDGSLPRGVRTVCHRFVSIPSRHCLNLAAAVYITLYDRVVKRSVLGLQELPSLDGEQRGGFHTPKEEYV